MPPRRARPGSDPLRALGSVAAAATAPLAAPALALGAPAGARARALVLSRLPDEGRSLEPLRHEVDKLGRALGRAPARVHRGPSQRPPRRLRPPALAARDGRRGRRRLVLGAVDLQARAHRRRQLRRRRRVVADQPRRRAGRARQRGAVPERRRERADRAELAVQPAARGSAAAARRSRRSRCAAAARACASSARTATPPTRSAPTSWTRAARRARSPPATARASAPARASANSAESGRKFLAARAREGSVPVFARDCRPGLARRGATAPTTASPAACERLGAAQRAGEDEGALERGEKAIASSRARVAGDARLDEARGRAASQPSKTSAHASRIGSLVLRDLERDGGDRAGVGVVGLDAASRRRRRRSRAIAGHQVGRRARRSRRTAGRRSRPSGGSPPRRAAPCRPGRSGRASRTGRSASATICLTPVPV